MNKTIQHTQSADETMALAASLSGCLHAPLVIYLSGELGAGKTTFVRGLLRGLGYEGIVKSPTYTLVEPYEFTSFIIYHFDLYRLSDPEELEYAGGRDYFSAAAINIVEWPEKAQQCLPGADIELQLNVAKAAREITFSAMTPVGETVLLAAFSK